MRFGLCFPVVLPNVGKQKVQDTVSKLCTDHGNVNDGPKVLNIGFGLGIVRYHYLRSEKNS